MHAPAQPQQILLPEQAYINANWRSHQMPFHRHGFLEINYLLYGSCDYIVDGRLYTVKKKNLILIDSSLPHRKVFNHSVPCAILGCALSLCAPAFQAMPFQAMLASSAEVASLLRQTSRAQVFADGSSVQPDLQALFNEFSGAHDGFYLHVLASKLLLSAARLQERAGQVQPDYLVQILQFIQTHYAQIRTVADVADHIKLNPVYMERIFKKSQGCTIWDYVIDCKLARSRDLLARRELPVGEVCELVGMNTRQTFYIQFKKKYGLSPSAYKKQVVRQDRI